LEKLEQLPSSNFEERSPVAIERTAENRKWLVLVAIGTSTFMTALDTSVVNAVLPVINQSFGSQVTIIQWVVTIYLLVVSGLLLSFGRLGDLRGHKPIFLSGFGIFIISSALCGLATSAGTLIAFRGLQAFGAAMLAANSPAILTKSFPANQRGQALGLQATMTYLGLTVAPSVGGWLTDLLSWRAVFFINVPVGLVAFLLSWYFIPMDEGTKNAERFDLTGALLFMAGLVTLLLGLNQGAEWGWASAPILVLFITAVLFLTIFYFVEKRQAHPMLDLSLFSKRLFTTSTASALINYMALFSILFLMPFYLLQGRSLSPSQAGLILTAQPIVMAIIAPLSGTVSDRIGTRLPAVLGMSILAVALYLLSTLGPTTPLTRVALFLGLAGLGTGTFISPNNSALMGSAPRNRQGIAAGILATARSAGMVLGVGLAGAIFTTILAASKDASSLFNATHASFLAACGIAILGTITAMFRE
jgi:EmrB/QacA subfamily drug resistance transporter